MSYYDPPDDEAYCPHPSRVFAHWLDSAGWLDPFGDMRPVVEMGSGTDARDLWAETWIAECGDCGMREERDLIYDRIEVKDVA
jgi:hypothetical protein